MPHQLLSEVRNGLFVEHLLRAHLQGELQPVPPPTGRKHAGSGEAAQADEH